MSIIDQLKDVVGKSDAAKPVPYWLPTSLPNINMAVSGDADKGFPGGRIITISGPESCGKTALATELMTQSQRQGGFAFFEDFEHAFDHMHAAAIGLECDEDSENWLYKMPATAEEGFARVYKVMQVLRAGALGKQVPDATKKDPQAASRFVRDLLKSVDLSEMMPIVGCMDSIASMIPEAQDIDYDQQNMKTKNMEHAAMLSIELKRLARDASDTGTMMILLNQLRTNPGVMFGDNTTEPGGNAPKFYASQQIRLRRVSKWYETYGDNKTPVIGDVVELHTRKNKVFRPFQSTRYVFRTIEPVGLDLVGTMIYLGKEAGALGAVTGTTVEFDGKKRWSIKDFDAACRADDDLRQRLADHVMGTVMPVTEKAPLAEDGDGNAFKV